jgi:hypothetical protein
MEEMVANTNTKQNEPDTIGYEWTINDDKTQCHIHERYAEAAQLSHTWQLLLTNMLGNQWHSEV